MFKILEFKILELNFQLILELYFGAHFGTEIILDLNFDSPLILELNFGGRQLLGVLCVPMCMVLMSLQVRLPIRPDSLFDAGQNHLFRGGLTRPD